MMGELIVNELKQEKYSGNENNMFFLWEWLKFFLKKC